VIENGDGDGLGAENTRIRTMDAFTPCRGEGQRGKPNAQTDTKTGTDPVLELPAAVGA
jgi:hypothetical protein